MARIVLAGLTGSVLMLAACEETMTAETTADLGSGLPDPVQSACMAAVADASGDGNVTVLSTAAASTSVVVGVGEDRTPWRCDADGGTVRSVAPMVG